MPDCGGMGLLISDTSWAEAAGLNAKRAPIAPVVSNSDFSKVDISFGFSSFLSKQHKQLNQLVFITIEAACDNFVAVRIDKIKFCLDAHSERNLSRESNSWWGFSAFLYSMQKLKI